MRTGLLLLVLVSHLSLGCKPALDPTGTYKVMTVQSEGKSIEVGTLEFDRAGTWKGKVGQLDVSGRWTATGEEIKVTNDVGAVTPDIQADSYKPVGNRLVPVIEGVEARHWYLEK